MRTDPNWIISAAWSGGIPSASATTSCSFRPAIPGLTASRRFSTSAFLAAAQEQSKGQKQQHEGTGGAGVARGSGTAAGDSAGFLLLAHRHALVVHEREARVACPVRTCVRRTSVRLSGGAGNVCRGGGVSCVFTFANTAPGFRACLVESAGSALSVAAVVAALFAAAIRNARFHHANPVLAVFLLAAVAADAAAAVVAACLVQARRRALANAVYAFCAKCTGSALAVAAIVATVFAVAVGYALLDAQTIVIAVVVLRAIAAASLAAIASTLFPGTIGKAVGHTNVLLAFQVRAAVTATAAAAVDSTLFGHAVRLAFAKAVAALLIGRTATAASAAAIVAAFFVCARGNAGAGMLDALLVGGTVPAASVATVIAAFLARTVGFAGTLPPAFFLALGHAQAVPLVLAAVRVHLADADFARTRTTAGRIRFGAAIRASAAIAVLSALFGAEAVPLGLAAERIQLTNTFLAWAIATARLGHSEATAQYA